MCLYLWPTTGWVFRVKGLALLSFFGSWLSCHPRQEPFQDCFGQLSDKHGTLLNSMRTKRPIEHLLEGHKAAAMRSIKVNLATWRVSSEKSRSILLGFDAFIRAPRLLVERKLSQLVGLETFHNLVTRPRKGHRKFCG